MHQPLIIQHLFQVSSLEDVSRERLEAFVEAYPSYGIGHYLLSCKLQAEGSERFVPETQRTCLYFSNPLWLQWQLQNSAGSAAAGPAENGYREGPVIEAVPAAPVIEEPVASVVEEPVASVIEEPVAPAIEEPVAPAIEETVAPAIEEPNVEAIVENVVTVAEETYIAPASFSAGEVEHLTAGEGDNLMAMSAVTEEPTAAEQLLRSIEEARELRESLQKLNDESAGPETYEAAPESMTHETVVLHEEPVVAEPAAPYEEPIRDEETPFVLEEAEEQPAVLAETAAAPAEETPALAVAETAAVPAVAETAAAAVAETPAAADAQGAPEPQAAAETPAAPESPKAATVTQDFLFEPYHTIDYFASQGIKLTLDENPQDKLGKQLKSFTEWLKVMRRLPQKDREVVPDRVMEEAIQTSAAHSIQGKDVLTETMAEVLAKQGMREKARAVYEKLSLLNPDKRAYFAAKIEQLNIP
jgi:hypothetical protein